MQPFARYEKWIDEQNFTFDFYWNEKGQLTRVVCLDKNIIPLLQEQPPHGIAALIRDLKTFFTTGEPLHPLHWSLLDDGAVTDFSRKVFHATLQIPHGETRTYAWIAKKIGKPLASRAVGQALRRNPFPILIPCHRVVSDKSLGGFMGCDSPEDLEIKFKSWLLNFELNYRNPCFSFVDSRPRLTGLVS